MSTTDWVRDRTEIAHLSVRYRAEEKEGADATLLRLRVERALNNIELQPAGLRAGEIFIVRKLSGLAPVSLPSLFYLAPRGWRESVRTQVEALYTSASRPAREPVSSDAASVLFADAGEMLACFTRDLLAGNARWYWQPILRNMPTTTGTTLATIWSRHAEYVPAALASLSIDEAITAIATFTPSEVYAVTSALHQAFELPPAALAMIADLNTRRSIFSNRTEQDAAPAQARQPRSEGYPEHPITARDYPSRNQVAPEAIVAPWRRWLDRSSIPILSPQAHYLLGLGLLLYHAPAFARSTSFSQNALSWLRVQAQQPPAVRQSASVHMESRLVEPSEEPSETADGPRAFPVDTPAEPGAPIQPGGDARSTPLPASSSGTQSAQTEQEPKHDALPAAVEQDKETRESGRRRRRPFIFGARQPLPAEGAPTELGGVLYLIHLLHWLELPGSWDEDGAFSTGMSGWAIIEALARGLLGASGDEYAGDPMWDLLAALDGREPGTLLGAGLTAQVAFRLPASWLPHAGSSQPAWHGVVGHDRLLLFDSEDGYLVADVPLSGRSIEAAAMAEIEAYRSHGIYAHLQSSEDVLPGIDDISYLTGLSEALAWWLAHVLGFVRAYLLRRLDYATGAEQLAFLLLCRPGQLIASRTHIDLHMPLDMVSLPVRSAGFDHDPGWVPDLGRIVLFHFD